MTDQDGPCGQYLKEQSGPWNPLMQLQYPYSALIQPRPEQNGETSSIATTRGRLMVNMVTVIIDNKIYNDILVVFVILNICFTDIFWFWKPLKCFKLSSNLLRHGYRYINIIQTKISNWIFVDLLEILLQSFILNNE